MLLGLLVAAPAAAGDACEDGGDGSPPAILVDAPATGVLPPPGADWRFEVSERQCVFEIDARDEAQVDRVLAEREASGTPRWHGLTRADFDIRFETEPTAAGCRFIWLQMQVDISLWLPRWQPPSPVRLRQGRRWQARLEVLRQHELAHRDQKVATAIALYRELATLAAADCSEFDRRARSRIERALLWLRLKSEALDALTDHGRRPPPAR
jgi:predicted secreted Zn-dependent protease